MLITAMILVLDSGHFTYLLTTLTAFINKHDISILLLDNETKTKLISEEKVLKV